eukprot:9486627-Lingulodinium_polyedra.AAC.2
MHAWKVIAAVTAVAVQLQRLFRRPASPPPSPSSVTSAIAVQHSLPLSPSGAGTAIAVQRRRHHRCLASSPPPSVLEASFP